MFGAVIYSENEQHLVHLCDLVIQYASPNEPIKLAGNLLITPKSKEPIYLIHRGSLESVHLASLGEWIGDGSDGIPYLYIFRNIVSNRAIIKPNGEATVRKIVKDSPHITDDYIDAKLLTEPIQAKEFFPHQNNDEVRENRPFTIIRVGPFPEDNDAYLFRIEAVMNYETAERLDLIGTQNGTTRYDIEGGKALKTRLETVEIPDSSKLGGANYYEEDALLFKYITEGMHELIPEMYSIIALKNPLIAGDGFLGNGEVNLVQANIIDSKVYAHPFFNEMKIPAISWVANKGGLVKFNGRFSCWTKDI